MTSFVKLLFTISDLLAKSNFLVFFGVRFCHERKSEWLRENEKSKIPAINISDITTSLETPQTWRKFRVAWDLSSDLDRIKTWEVTSNVSTLISYNIRSFFLWYWLAHLTQFLSFWLVRFVCFVNFWKHSKNYSLKIGILCHFFIFWKCSYKVICQLYSESINFIERMDHRYYILKHVFQDAEMSKKKYLPT